MTKASYFEMCETLGTEPNPDEIPVEQEDFPEFVQQVFNIYAMLSDQWDPMGGNYLGKNLSIVFRVFDLYEFTQQEQILAVYLIQLLDKTRAEIVYEKQNQKTPKT